VKKQYFIASLFLCLTSLIFYSFSFLSNTENYNDPVMTESGLVSGVQSESGIVTAYKGIPYAAPPLGDQRWKAPQPAIPWQGIRKCDVFGPSPMQPKPIPFMVYTSEFLIPENPISEDCLYLNIWTGAKKGNRRPVFVWIYGGGFSSGGTAVPIYDGEAMAKKGIIFVSVNYRVGVFGFLAHPDLTKESPLKSSGNYGLLDQLAALQWIKKNINAFGGDPDNVTVGGQSAGSMSVNCLVASPLANGLIHKAISESGSFFVMKTKNLNEAEKQGIDLASFVHAGSLEDLRKMPADQLMKFPAQYFPIVDGYVLPESIPDIFAEGKENNVPLITGWNADESFLNGIKNKDAFQKEAREKYGKDADEFLKYFPANSDEEAMRSQIMLSRNTIFALSGYKWANIQSDKRRSPVYLYYFARKLPATGDYTKYGAFHTGEVAYVLDNLKFLYRPWEQSDYQLAELMSNYWVNFISGSNPNGRNLPDWPSYNTKTFQVMVFDKESGKQLLPGKDGLDFMSEKLAKQ
jgi:para-nitrobenzyl esterase